MTITSLHIFLRMSAHVVSSRFFLFSLVFFVFFENHPARFLCFQWFLCEILKICGRFMKLCSIDILLGSAKSEQAPLCVRLGRMFAVIRIFLSKCSVCVTLKMVTARFFVIFSWRRSYFFVTLGPENVNITLNQQEYVINNFNWSIFSYSQWRPH